MFLCTYHALFEFPALPVDPPSTRRGTIKNRW